MEIYTYRLTSMYRHADFLLFQMKSNMSLVMIDTKFSKTKMVEELFKVYQDFPVFLSALTTTLFGAIE